MNDKLVSEHVKECPFPVDVKFGPNLTLKIPPTSNLFAHFHWDMSINLINITSFSCHEQVWLIRLLFEGYFSHHQAIV